MFAVTARTAIRVGRVGLRSVATNAKPNNANKFKFVAGGTAAAGAGTVTYALLGFGSSGPNWAKLREDIADMINDDTAFNPSK